MKRSLKVLFGVLVLFSIMSVSSIRAEAGSYVDFNKKEIVAKSVLDVDNAVYPATDKYYVNTGSHESAKFMVAAPSVIKVYYTWDTGEITSVNGDTWISRDEEGVDVVGVKTKVSKAPTSAVFYLDPGVYYLNHKLTIKKGNEEFGDTIGIALLQHAVPGNEGAFVTSFESPNELVWNTDFTGFLSNNAPNDYYYLIVEEYSRVDFTFNFRKEGGAVVSKGTCSLYDINHRLLVKKTFNENNALQNQFSEYLEKGKYYIELGGATGPTYLRANVVPYAITCETVTKGYAGKVDVKVNFGFDATEVLVLAGEISEARKNDNNTWNTRNGAVDITNKKVFSAENNDTYTVRVKDTAGKYYLAAFTVDTVDADVPHVTGIEQGGVYTGKVEVVVSDSHLSKVTLDKKNVKLKKAEKKGKAKILTISGNGSHKLVVKDSAGNSVTVKFTIKPGA